MLKKIKRWYGMVLVSCAEFFPFLVAIKYYGGNRFGHYNPKAFVIAASVAGAFGFLAWLSCHRRIRSIEDTPTSQVAYAAQGYIELSGRASPCGGEPLLSEKFQQVCVWYRTRIERRIDFWQWQTESEDESTAPFYLKDDTGECLLYPDDAEVLANGPPLITSDSNLRCSEWIISIDDKIHAIGKFRTTRPNLIRQQSDTVNNLLTQWKEDKPELLKRFDSNNDGQIDLKEWEMARQEAQKMARQQMSEISQDGTHEMVASDDERPFIITNRNTDDLTRAYKNWSYFHLTIFLVCAPLSAFLVKIYLMH